MTIEQQIELCKRDFYDAVKYNNPKYALECVRRLKSLRKQKKNEI